MKKPTTFNITYDDLPPSLPIFPLPNAILMPGSELPLNIFEPRYLAMLQDSLKSHQLVGMIQPSDENTPPSLHRVGCAGRVTGYQETDDGRMHILLTGVCRFTITSELPTLRGYRLVTPNWSEYTGDFKEQTLNDEQLMLPFKAALRTFMEAQSIQVEWDKLEELEHHALVNGLLGYLPLASEDKQIVIEADTFTSRVVAFIAILEAANSASTVSH